jgi:hypothetical protein
VSNSRDKRIQRRIRIRAIRREGRAKIVMLWWTMRGMVM